MIRSQKFWVAVALLVIIGSAVWSYLTLRFWDSGSTVNIICDGKVLYTIDLSKEPDREITVEYEGRKNIITIKSGRIRVTYADCPDHYCISQGWGEEGSLLPIICLPNRLVIEPADSQLDGVAR